MEFPREFEAVPANARMIEALGVTPISFALGCLIALVGSIVGVVQFGYSGIADLYPALGCLAGFVLFLVIEVWRRTSRWGLAFAGSQVGIYRKGQLDKVVPRAQLGIYQLSILNTIRELLAYGALGSVALLASGMIFEQLMFGLWALGATVALGGGLLSSVYIRLVCRHFMIAPDQTQIAFTKGDLARLGM